MTAPTPSTPLRQTVMNLVRRARIQCVGIGEARMEWLRPIALQTGGRAVQFTKDGMKEAGPEPAFPGMPEDMPEETPSED